MNEPKVIYMTRDELIAEINRLRGDKLKTLRAVREKIEERKVKNEELSNYPIVTNAKAKQGEPQPDPENEKNAPDHPYPSKPSDWEAIVDAKIAAVEERMREFYKTWYKE
jgi:hypothetical protein